MFPVPDSAPGTYCVHHKLVALESRPIRNKTSCCCQVREGKCTLCPEDYRPLLFSRPFLDMVYHALDSPDDDYHALFVLCLLYAMSHNKGRHAPHHLQCLTQCSTVHWYRGRREGGRALWEGVSFLASEVTATMLFFSHITISQVFLCRLKPQALVTQAWWWEIQVWLSKPVRLASHCGFLQTPLCFTTNLTNDHFDISAKPVKLEPWFCYL